MQQLLVYFKYARDKIRRFLVHRCNIRNELRKRGIFCFGKH
jgi:hypothetical protein